MRHPEGPRRFHLSFGNREQAGTVVLRLIRGIIESEPENARGERIEFDTQIGKPVENQ